MKIGTMGVGALALALAAPALAQDGPSAASGNSVFDGDYVSVAVGPAYGPSYDGSDDYVLYPAALVQGSLGGIDFTSRGAGLAVDFISDPDDGIGFDLGVAGQLRGNRARQIEDPVVESLGELDYAIEVGPTVGIGIPKLLNPYDSLSASVDASWDINGAHGGMVIEPSVTYFTPLSRAIAASLSLSAEHGDGQFMDYYYSVTPAQSLASGLPAFDPDGGGWTKAGGNLLLGFDLDGNLENGGLALALVGSYMRMLGDAERSPFTSVRGDADQWAGAIGIGYTF
jgi:outer membrane scaffolding protein for murein synthesis (MipA/OmpV family)